MRDQTAASSNDHVNMFLHKQAIGVVEVSEIRHHQCDPSEAIISSMRNGPSCLKLCAISSAQESMLVACAASTPKPLASFTQSSGGLPKSSMLSAVVPGVAPTFLYSPSKMLYVRLFKRIVVQGRCSWACVHNACSEYIAEP